MTTAYTIGTRVITKGLLGVSKTSKEVATIEENGAWYADVPAGADANAIIDHLNSIAQETGAKVVL